MYQEPNQKGFSLVELTIVVVILGILATLAVPRFLSSVEKSKAAEGLSYLHQMESQQARFMATTGRYAYSKKELGDVLGESIKTPTYFDTSAMSSSNWELRWSTKLTRNGASSGFGRYTITWGQDGFVAKRSSIPSALKPDGGGSAALSSSAPSSSGGSSSSSSSSSAGDQNQDSDSGKSEAKKDKDSKKKDKDSKKKDKDSKKKDKRDKKDKR